MEHFNNAPKYIGMSKDAILKKDNNFIRIFTYQGSIEPLSYGLCSLTACGDNFSCCFINRLSDGSVMNSVKADSLWANEVAAYRKKGWAFIDLNFFRKKADGAFEKCSSIVFDGEILGVDSVSCVRSKIDSEHLGLDKDVDYLLLGCVVGKDKKVVYQVENKYAEAILCDLTSVSFIPFDFTTL